jgi:predicted ABC-type ATPase
MWIVAGPNGSGKTSITRTRFIQRQIGEPVAVLNPDDIAREVQDGGVILQDQASRIAAQLSDEKVDRHIEENRSFIIETVLSSEKFKPRVERAIQLGFSIGLTFVILRSRDVCVERVQLRVKLNGHSVPEDKIRSRWPKSIQNLRWFAERSHVVQIIDNSKPEVPEVLVEKRNDGHWYWRIPGRMPEIDAALAGLS